MPSTAQRDFDTAAFSGNRADYAISYDAGTQSFTVADQRAGSPDGTDTVYGVESFQFADGSAEYDALGRLAKWTVLSSDGSLSVTRYDTDQSQPWATYTSTFNGLGPLAGSNVSYDDGSSQVTQYNAADIASWSSQTGAGGAGTHAVTITDSADAFEWATYTNVIDGNGSLLSQTGTLDNGGHWLNVYDTAAAFAWSSYFNIYDPNTQVIWQSGNQDNGSHWLTVLDANGSYSWSQATVVFDANWNLTALGGINDDGSHLVAPDELSQVYDTLAWSPSAYVPAQHLWPQSQLWGGTVAENAAAGAVVGTVAGALSDGGTVLNFALTDSAGGRFTIDPATGVVTAAGGAQLDYESAVSQTIAVRTTDASGGVTDQAFTIAITDVNDAPTGATLSGNTVAENSPNGTVVGTVSGIDPDAGTIFRYSLQDGAAGRFSIDPNTGVVRVSDSAHLDYETASAHGIVVHAQDQGGLSVDKAFTIQITDVAGITLNGDGGANTLVGSPDNDTLKGFAGNDLLIGGDSPDTALYDSPASAYTVTSYGVTVAILSHGGEGNDRLQGIEPFSSPMARSRQPRWRRSIRGNISPPTPMCSRPSAPMGRQPSIITSISDSTRAAPSARSTRWNISRRTPI
jgi:hypothetical protein